MTKVAIVDYKCGNIKSLLNAFQKVGGDPVLVSDPNELLNYDRIVLPGVGAFKTAIDSLRVGGFIDALNQIYLSPDKSILGICLGLQLMCKRSWENGEHEGLGWFDADVLPFKELDTASEFKVPHMGWNSIELLRNTDLLADELNNQDFYFVHSYYVRVNDPDIAVANCDYITDFQAIVSFGNAMGIQFHPEKSQFSGLKILDAFVKFGCQQKMPEVANA